MDELLNEFMRSSDHEFLGTGYRILGSPPNVVMDTLQNADNIIFISGKFGTGKTSLIRTLMRTCKRYVFITKITPRTPRKLEREGKVPFTGMSFDKILKQSDDRNESYFICRNVDYEQQDLFAAENPIKFISQFLSFYSINYIFEQCVLASIARKFLIFEITPEQEKDWLFFFPKGRFIRLVTEPEIRMNRLRRRRQKDPDIDPSGNITELKIKTAERIDESNNSQASFYLYDLKEFKNNRPRDMFRICLHIRYGSELKKSRLFKTLLEISKLFNSKTRINNKSPGS